MAEYLKLGALEFSTTNGYKILSIDFPEPKRERIDFSHLDIDGEEIVERRYKNAIRSFELLVEGTSRDNLISRIRSIEQEAYKDTNVLEYKPYGATNSSFSDIVFSQATTNVDHKFWTSYRAKVSVTLEAKPFWRAKARREILIKNYIRNSSFERDSNRDGVPNHWTYYCSDAAINATRGLIKVGWPSGYHGKYCFTIEASGGTGTGYANLYQDVYGFKPGEVLTLSGHFKTETSTNATYQFLVIAYDEAGSAVGTSYALNTAEAIATWTRYQISFTVPGNTHRLNVQVRLNVNAAGGGGRISADAVQLERGSAASDYYLGTTLIPNPTSLTLTATTGTLAAATYYYTLLAFTEHGETNYITASITLAATGGVKLDWAEVPGAKGYQIHRSQGSDNLLTEVGRVLTFTDDGSITPSGTGVTLSSVNSAYTNFNPTVFSFAAADILGDVPPLVRIFAQGNTMSLQKIWIGYRSGKMAKEPVLKFEAEEGEQTGWTEFSDPSYSNGLGISKSLTAGETSTATGFSKKISLVKGRYKVLLKAASDAAAGTAQFRYRVKSGTGSDKYGDFIVVSSHVIADLGTVIFPTYSHLSDSDPLQYIYIDAKNADTVARNFYLDYFILLPVDEGFDKTALSFEDGTALIVDRSEEGMTVWKQQSPFISPTDSLHSAMQYSILSQFTLQPNENGWLVVLTQTTDDIADRDACFDFGVEYTPRYLFLR